MDLLPNIKCDLTPLVQWVPNGVNKILGLYFGPKIARQKAVECLIAAQAERNAAPAIPGLPVIIRTFP